jgi:hypothetical protein
VSNHISPGERNPVEGKFGQAKTAYGMDNICAKLKTTSESWIGSIVLVLNLVKLMRLIPLWIKLKIIKIKKCINIFYELFSQNFIFIQNRKNYEIYCF